MAYVIFKKVKNWRFDKKPCKFMQIQKNLVEQLVE